MKRALGISLIAGLLFTGITQGGIPTPTTRSTDANELNEMRQMVKELADRNASLERQVAELKQQMQSFSIQSSTVVNQAYPDFAPPLSMRPPGTPHLFNDGIYYTIPVNARHP